MFTGIVERTGVARGFRRGREVLVVEAPALGAVLKPGDSLAVDGACLTVAGVEAGGRFLFDLSKETREKTTLGSLRPGDRVNLETPLTLSTLVSGHLVTGHVDAVGTVSRVSARPPGKRLRVAFPPGLRPFLVPKGSVAVDGVSLTVAALEDDAFEVELIPATLAATTLGALRTGDGVNLECDMVGKYVYNWMSRPGPSR